MTKNEFIDYVFDFYGEDGVYAHFFDPSPSRKEITVAVEIVASQDGFCEDSVDRELTRDVMFALRGTTQDLEYPQVLDWIARL